MYCTYGNKVPDLRCQKHGASYKWLVQQAWETCGKNVHPWPFLLFLCVFPFLLWNKQMRYNLLISSLSLIFIFMCNHNLTFAFKVQYIEFSTSFFWKASSFLLTQVIHVIFAFLLESFPIPYRVPMSFLWIHNMIGVYNCVMSSKHRVWTSTLWEAVGDIGKPAGSPHMKWHVEAGHHHEVDLPLFTTHRP